MNRYSEGSKRRMDARTWNSNFEALLFNRSDTTDLDFRDQICELGRLAQGHFFRDSRYLAINRKFSRFLATEGKWLARYACKRLYDLATDSRTITMAIRQAAKIPGSRTPGVDGKTINDYRKNVKDISWARGIRDRVRSDDYCPEPMRLAPVKKKAGGRRSLSIPTIEDRVIQRSIKLAIDPYLDAHFLPTSFGSRRRRDRLDALATAMLLAKEIESPWVVAVDIKNAYPSTSKARLMQTVRKYMHDGEICGLVEQSFSNCSKGMPQGAPLSPILVNLHLHHLIDKPWAKLEGMPPLLRYVDDLLVVCGSCSEAEHCYEALNRLVTQNGYRLKTNLEQSVFDASESGDGFDWLGYMVQLKPFSVSLGDQKWLELESKLDKVKSDHPEEAEEHVDDVVFNWAKQELAPMAYGQLDSVQAKIEYVLGEIGLPTEYHSFSLHELHEESKRRWSLAISSAEKSVPLMTGLE